MWTDKFDSNTLRVDAQLYKSATKNCGFKNIWILVDGALSLGSVMIALCTKPKTVTIKQLYQKMLLQNMKSLLVTNVLIDHVLTNYRVLL